MKKLLLLFICCSLFAMTSNAQCGNLYIAGVIDAGLTGGTPKGVQFCATATIADLSIYGFGSANNGGGSDGEEFTFPDDMVTAGSCFWVASESTQFNNFFGFTPCYTAGAANINGDDAIELFCNSSVVDVFGDISGGNSGWNYQDGWAKAADAVASTTFDASDWTFSGANALDGETSNATADTPYPTPDQDCPAPLPVELIGFDAKSQNEVVALFWQTASEENNSHFEVEHSTNGRDFQMLNKVTGNGTTADIQEYNYIHEEAALGKNYYRLRQVDFDGAFEYSDVAVVELKSEEQVQVRPTLVNENVSLVFGKETREEVQVQVVDVAGRQVMNAMISEGTTQADLPVTSLEKGLYFVQLVLNGELTTVRFVKR